MTIPSLLLLFFYISIFQMTLASSFPIALNQIVTWYPACTGVGILNTDGNTVTI